MAKNKVTITNAELGTVQAALRECGNTKIPMGVALRMVEVQRLIKDRIEDVQELKLPEQFTLYQDGDELGWAEGTNGVSLSPNTIIDMAALLRIEKAE